MDCPYSKQPCDDKKILHVTELKDGSYTDLHMCEKCAAKYTGGPVEPEVKQEPETPSSLGGLVGLLSLLMLGTVASQKRATVRNTQATKCPGCGTTPEDISKTGRFGCAKCYEYYQASVEHVLQKCHQGATKHVGKVPKRFTQEQKNRRLEEEAAISVQDQIKSLEAKMTKAIKVENYEVAGVLKLKIQELRQLQNEKH